MGQVNQCQTCNQKALAQGIMMPECPPANDIEFSSSQPEAEYYLQAFASHEIYKATYDLLIGGC